MVRDRDTTGKECITIAIAIAMTGAITAMIADVVTTMAAGGIEMIIAATSTTVATMETMSIVRQGIGIAAIRATGAATTARVRLTAM